MKIRVDGLMRWLVCIWMGFRLQWLIKKHFKLYEKLTDKNLGQRMGGATLFYPVDKLEKGIS